VLARSRVRLIQRPPPRREDDASGWRSRSRCGKNGIHLRRLSEPALYRLLLWCTCARERHTFFGGTPEDKCCPPPTRSSLIIDIFQQKAGSAATKGSQSSASWLPFSMAPLGRALGELVAKALSSSGIRPLLPLVAFAWGAFDAADAPNPTTLLFLRDNVVP
jgi:hypothetical protein